MSPRLLSIMAISGLLWLAACSAPTTASTRASDPGARYFVNTDASGVALQGGHDPVAFFTEQKPVQGNKRWQARHEGATYWFTSEENLRTFEANPARYAPSYGGYCGYAASIGRVSPIDVDHFQVLDGRLVLQHNQRGFDLWNKDVPASLRQADSNWPGIAERNARPAKVLVNVNRAGLALEGHDPVAYFTEHRPVPGQEALESHYNGAVYRFASAENRETFERSPAQYVPAFGGYCGYAASIDKVSPVNVHIFQIIDGRLVLQHTPKAYRLFNEDALAALARADQNWPGLVARKGR
jgi:YHS domain-containing protein